MVGSTEPGDLIWRLINRKIRSCGPCGYGPLALLIGQKPARGWNLTVPCLSFRPNNDRFCRVSLASKRGSPQMESSTNLSIFCCGFHYIATASYTTQCISTSALCLARAPAKRRSSPPRSCSSPESRRGIVQRKLTVNVYLAHAELRPIEPQFALMPCPMARRETMSADMPIQAPTS